MTTTAACGGEGALKKLTDSAPLVGLAAQSQSEVEAELATDGRAAIVQRAAIRLEAVSRLFFNAILSAADKGDTKALALYAQRFAWLQSRALGAWAQVRDEEKSGRGGRRRTLDAVLGKGAGGGEEGD